MAVWSNSWPLGTQPTSFYAPSVGFAIQVVTVYNNSPAQLSISEYPQAAFPGNGIIVPAGYPMNIAVAGWTSLAFISDGTAPAAKSSLVVIANDNPLALSTALSLFGPSGWGAGALPNVLTSLNVGDPIAAWNVNQLINYITGNAAGPVGPITGTELDVKAGTRDQWSLIASAQHQLELLDGATNTFWIFDGSTGQLTGLGRITTPSTGASGKQLLNVVPVTPTVTAASGTGDSAVTALTLSGLPSSAVMASIWCRLSTSGTLTMTDGSGNTVMQTTVIGGINGNINGFIPVKAGASNQVQYQVTGTGGGAWALQIMLLGYAEPS